MKLVGTTILVFLIFGSYFCSAKIIAKRPNIKTESQTCAQMPYWMIHPRRVRRIMGNRVLGGKTAEQSIPWQVSLRPYFDHTIFQHFCGGTILDSTTILTAAHCARTWGPKALEQSNFLILAGSVRGSYPEQQRAVTRTIAHELYDSGKTEGHFNQVDAGLAHYDIALMKLKEPLEFNENVYPACLPSLDTSYSSLDGKIGFASGWGQSYWGGQAVEKLQFLPLHIRNTKYLIEKFAEFSQYKNLFEVEKVFDNMICTYNEGTVEQNVLRGDSGGPLVVPDNNFAFVHGIAGVVIKPDDVSKENPPRVACFTRITSHLDWIQAKRAELDG